jgi:hypothetical protein
LKIMKVIEHGYEHQEGKKLVDRSDWLDLVWETHDKI